MHGLVDVRNHTKRLIRVVRQPAKLLNLQKRLSRVVAAKLVNFLWPKSPGHVYFVGGVTRSGTSLLAGRVSATLGIPILSLDYLVKGFVTSMPQLGFSDQNSDDEQARLMWPFLKRVIEAMLWDNRSYVLEGSAVLPQYLKELLEDHPGQVRACCLGYAKIDQFSMLRRIRQQMAIERWRTAALVSNDWMCQMEDEEVLCVIRDGIERSRAFAAECTRLKLPYFDISGNFAATQESAFEYLLGRKGIRWINRAVSPQRLEPTSSSMKVGEALDPVKEASVPSPVLSIKNKQSKREAVNREKLLHNLKALYASEAQQFGLTEFYQSLEVIGINTAFRSTEKRFQFYDIPAYVTKEHRVADIGCNTGFLSIMISFFVNEIQGFDSSVSLIQIAEAAAAFLNIQNVTFKVSRFENMICTEPYDCILALAEHRWIPMPFGLFVNRLKSFLKQGGLLFFETNDLRNYDQDIDAKIEQFQARGFSILRKDDVPHFDGEIGGWIPRRVYLLRNDGARLN